MTSGDPARAASSVTGTPVDRSFEHSSALDGVRAIAVTGVVAYHLWPSLLPGGFIGVDIFFVLSGFLLSALLIRETERTGAVDFRAFVLRRVRRLLPATLLVLCALAVYATLWANEAEVVRLRRQTFGVLTYTTNWLFIADGTTYTDVIVGASPLRHMWSLAIEEQFYIALALGVVVLVRRSVRAGPGDHARTSGDTAREVRHRVLVISTSLAGLSATLMIALSLTGSSTDRLYFGTDTRMQAMLIGVALGAARGEYLLNPSPALGSASPRSVRALMTLSIVTVTAIALFGREQAPWMYRGGFTIVALAGGGVIVTALTSTRAMRVLSTRPLVGLGAISYGVYLWHWPVLVIIDDDRLGRGGIVLAAVRLTVTMAAAIGSYRFVEQPIRRGRLRLSIAGRSWSGSPVATCAVATAVVVATAMPMLDINESPHRAARFAQTSNGIAGDPLRIAVLGDSVAHSLIGGDLHGLIGFSPWTSDDTTFDPNIVSITSVTRPACSFLPGEIVFDSSGATSSTADLSANCDEWASDLDAALSGEDPVELTVVLLTNDMFDRLVDGDVITVGSTRWIALLRDWLDEVAAIAVRDDSKLVLLATAARSDPDWVEPEGVREHRVADILRGYADDHQGVEMIDLEPFVRDHDDLRSDGLHYTVDGAIEVAEWLTPRLIDSLD